MKTLKFENREDWMNARRGKVTGSKLKDIYSKRNPENKKIGFYELIADKISTAPTDEPQRDIGVRLEGEAVDRFAKETKKKIDKTLVMWVREDDSNIAYSPDAFIPAKKITEAVEVKCLSAPKHIEAFLTQEVPDEYTYQTRQAFITNDELKTLYVAFYNPLIPCKDYFVIEIQRKDVQEEIEQLIEYERKTLQEVNDIVAQLTF